MTEYIEQDDDSMDLCGALAADGQNFCILHPGHGGTKHRGFPPLAWPIER